MCRVAGGFKRSLRFFFVSVWGSFLEYLGLLLLFPLIVNKSSFFDEKPKIIKTRMKKKRQKRTQFVKKVLANRSLYKKKHVAAVGFEPTPPKRLVP